MELLLILSALLTGLTGAFSEDRLRQRAEVQATGIEAAPRVDIERLTEIVVSREGNPVSEPPRLVDQLDLPGWTVEPAPRAPVIGASERRLE